MRTPKPPPANSASAPPAAGASRWTGRCWFISSSGWPTEGGEPPCPHAISRATCSGRRLCWCVLRPGAELGQVPIADRYYLGILHFKGNFNTLSFLSEPEARWRQWIGPLDDL